MSNDLSLVLEFEGGGLSAWSKKRTFHTTVTVWIANLSDKRQGMLACEFPFPRASLPNAFFPEK